jgi:hypothetical protein
MKYKRMGSITLFILSLFLFSSTPTTLPISNAYDYGYSINLEYPLDPIDIRFSISPKHIWTAGSGRHALEDRLVLGDKLQLDLILDPRYENTCKPDYKVEFLADGVPTGHYLDSPTEFSTFTYSSYDLDFTLDKVGLYSIKMLGKFNCIGQDGSRIVIPIDYSKDLLNVFKRSLPSPISVGKIVCPSNIRFSTSKDATYICTATLNDKSHVATNVVFTRTWFGSPAQALPDTAKRDWVRTSSGWNVRFKIFVRMLSPADYSTKRRVETYSISGIISQNSIAPNYPYSHYAGFGKWNLSTFQIKK